MIEWVTQTIGSAGVLGVFLLMFLENLFPPIPSELIMPLAGFAAADGRMSLAGAILAGTAGTVLGNAAWYEMARMLGSAPLRRLVARYGRWFAVSTEDMDRAEAALRRHGGLALCVGRILPGIRTLISVPAGLARIGRPVFYFATTLGATLWVGLLTLGGFLLRERFTRIETLLEPLSYVVMAGVVGAYLWHLWRSRQERQFK
jgi:membrane protein DedA with SNARE-associated domain